jgi:hypothetical protein
MEQGIGFEPMTFSLATKNSTAELTLPVGYLSEIILDLCNKIFNVA